MEMEFVGEGVGKLEVETMSFLVERTDLRGACDWLCGFPGKASRLMACKFPMKESQNING